MSTVTKEEWERWLSDPVTKALRAKAREEMRDLQERWANGLFVGDTDSRTLAMNAEAQGRFYVFSQIADMEWETVE